MGFPTFVILLLQVRSCSYVVGKWFRNSRSAVYPKVLKDSWALQPCVEQKLGQGSRNFLRARAQIANEFRRFFFSLAHGNFEEQNIVLEPSIIIINYFFIIIIIKTFCNYFIV